jgi:teichuronic acid exporter
MTISDAVFKGLRWAAFGRLVTALITWCITFFVIRLLSPEDYGLLNMGMIVIALTAVVGEFGLQAALIRLEHVTTEILRKAFGIILLSYLGLALIIILITPFIAEFYREERLNQILPILTIPVILSAFHQIPYTLVMRKMNYKPGALISVSAALLGSLGTLAVALMDGGVWALIVGQIIIAVVTVVGFNILSPFPYLPLFNFTGMSSIVTFGAKIIFQRIAWWLYSSIDQILIGRILSTADLGIYFLALHLSSIPRDKISGIINEVAYPAFSRLRSEGQEVKSYLSKALSLISLVFFPVFFGMSVVAAEAVPIILGETWRPAIIPMMLIPLTMPFRMLTTPIGEAMNALGHPRLVLYTILISLVMVAGMTWFGSRWGVNGVASGLCIAVLFNVFICFVITRRITGLGLRDLSGAIAKPLSAAMVMYVAVGAAIILTYGFGDPTNLVPPGALESWHALAAMLGHVVVGLVCYGGIIYLIDRASCTRLINIFSGAGQ